MSELPVNRDLWLRLVDEKPEEYEMFCEWCKIPPSSRNIGNLSRRVSLDSRFLGKLHDTNHWQQRALSFDEAALQLRPETVNMNDEIAKAAHYAAGQIFIELGLTAMQLKDPSRIPVSKAAKLVEMGTDMQRKAIGEADININITGQDMGRVHEAMRELGMEGFEDAEIVDEDESV